MASNASNNNTRSWQQGGSGYNDPAVFQDPAVNPFARQVASASDAQLLSQQRGQIASAARGVSGEPRQIANQLVSALEAVASTAQAHGTIRAFANAGGSGRANAAKALDAQRQIVADGIDQANAALAQLKPALLSAVAHIPAGATAEQIADKKSDLVAVLEGVGKAQANAKAQAILRQAIANNDGIMVWVLLAEPMQYQAEALGYRQLTLQAIYAAAMVEQYGLHPLASSQQVPGAELLSLLDTIKEAITAHGVGITSALNQLAAECNL